MYYVNYNNPSLREKLDFKFDELHDALEKAMSLAYEKNSGTYVTFGINKTYIALVIQDYSGMFKFMVDLEWIVKKHFDSLKHFVNQLSPKYKEFI